jgi:hypothetical protein
MMLAGNPPRGGSMKFLASWTIDQDKWLDVLTAWGRMSAKQRADAGRGVKMIGRWHDMASRSGMAVLEAKDIGDVYRYLGQWNPVMDVDITPVVDDAESARLAREIVRSHRG